MYVVNVLFIGVSKGVASVDMSLSGLFNCGVHVTSTSVSSLVESVLSQCQLLWSHCQVVCSPCPIL